MVKTAFIFSAFVFLFLFLFRPFGLYELQQDFIPTIAGYAIVCLLSMLLLNTLIPQLMPGFFTEKTWTAGREILWTLVNILLIGLANAVYSAAIGLFTLNLHIILTFEFFTLLIGIIPVTVSVLLKRQRLENRYTKQSEDLNLKIEQQQAEPELEPVKEGVLIEMGTGKDSLSISCTALLFIRSADNYVDVVFMEHGMIRHKLIRGTLKDMENLLTNLPQFFRCHKSYVVNLEKVLHVSGNAQGLKLQLPGIEEQIPVSRNYTTSIRERLADRPRA